MVEPILYNTDKWIEENKQDFHPPVGNKCMHGETQMKCFFVGGPNVRKDYHIEEGPEFFYMVTGDMCLKVMERNTPRDVVIKEGEVFMLPPRIPHSPQRQASTVGLVIERERSPQETDGLRYFVKKDGQQTSEILFERWFHCENLGPQLTAIINEYADTEQCKTGIPGKVLSYDEAPVKIDLDTTLDAPFSLNEWLENNKGRIEAEGSVDLFKATPQGAHVKVYGAGQVTMTVEKAEVFIWVLQGDCVVDCKEKERSLSLKDSLWLPVNMRFTLKVTDVGSRVLMVYMAPPV